MKNKPKELIAYEAHQIFLGKSRMLPTAEHFDYLVHLIIENGNSALKWVQDSEGGKEQAEKYYSQAFD